MFRQADAGWPGNGYAYFYFTENGVLHRIETKMMHIFLCEKRIYAELYAIMVLKINIKKMLQ
jgi:hypothetical protein